MMELHMSKYIHNRLKIYNYIGLRNQSPINQHLNPPRTLVIAVKYSAMLVKYIRT